MHVCVYLIASDGSAASRRYLCKPYLKNRYKYAFPVKKIEAIFIQYLVNVISEEPPNHLYL